MERWEIRWRYGIYCGEMGDMMETWDILWRDGRYDGEMGDMIILSHFYTKILSNVSEYNTFYYKETAVLKACNDINFNIDKDKVTALTLLDLR